MLSVTLSAVAPTPITGYRVNKHFSYASPAEHAPPPPPLSAAAAATGARAASAQLVPRPQMRGEEFN